MTAAPDHVQRSLTDHTSALSPTLTATAMLKASCPAASPSCSSFVSYRPIASDTIAKEKMVFAMS